jgi:hypothetical protein
MRLYPEPEDASAFHDLALESDSMVDFADWFPLATVGLTFTMLGSIKLWGLKRGIVGGADKPVVQRLCGT